MDVVIGQFVLQLDDCRCGHGAGTFACSAAHSSMVMNAIVRILSLTALLAGITLAGYWLMLSSEKDRALAELRDLNVQLERTLAQRQAMVERLSRSRRIAHVRIVDQQTGDRGDVASTSLEFIELDEGGAEIARQHITVPGDVVFVDAWTVKFDPAYVADGDPLRGRALVLLRRVYSDHMPARDGITLDVPGAVPPAYAADDMGLFEKRLWERFWELARSPAEAAKLGVSVAQGEAVYKPVRTGETYELVVDAVGGMSLKPLNPTAITRMTQDP